MTLLYRGIWQDDRPELGEAVVAQFQSWMASKNIDVRLPDEGTVDCEYDQGTCEVVVRRAIAGATSAVQVELSEERPGSGERWTSRLTAIETAGSEQWVWIDLERVADDSSQRPLWAAPRLACELIESGKDVRVDQVRLTTASHPIQASGLVGLIRNPSRTLPIVVFSEDPAGGITPTIRRADVASKALAGAVQVMYLPADQIDSFKGAIGEDLGVWGGAARVYLPNSGPSGLKPERHRYLSRQQMGEDFRRPSRTLALMLGGIVTARRPPAAYGQVRRELRLGRDRSDAELLGLAEEEMARLTAERDELKDQLEQLREELLDTQADFDEEVVRSTRLENQLQVMLIDRSTPEALEGTVDLAVEVGSIEEALQLARERLPGVVIPPGIEKDVEDLDDSVNSTAWGDITWRGLRALHLYAEAGFDGNFKQWCLDSGHVWAWSASDKKLAMRESEQVENNDRLKRQRLLPVDPAVDPSGCVHMWAHLKIAEGGGPMAPRVYFHDDTRGSTGKVHVGFVGPHKYMENTRTN